MNNKEKILNKVDDISEYIKRQEEYKNIIKIKDKMKSNNKINNYIDTIKKLQKEYIKTKDENIKKELDKNIKELNDIPLYNEYNRNLEIINEKIEYINDYINEFFDDVFNF